MVEHAHMTTPIFECGNLGGKIENRYVCPIMGCLYYIPTYFQFLVLLNERGKFDQIAGLGRVPNNITIICLYSNPTCFQPRNHLQPLFLS